MLDERTSEISPEPFQVANFANLIGIPLLWPNGRAIDGNRQFWIEDPDGNRLEVMEMDPNCLPYQGVKSLRETGKGVSATFPAK